MSGFETLSLRNTKQLAKFRSIDLNGTTDICRRIVTGIAAVYRSENDIISFIQYSVWRQVQSLL